MARWPWQRKALNHGFFRKPHTTYFIDGPLKDRSVPFQPCRYIMTAPILLRTREIIEGPRYRWDTIYANAAVWYARLDLG